MAKQPPNLIYIFADQWRRQAVGYEDEDPVITPNIDAFAQESTVLTDAVTVSPLCSPHRSSLLTGKYPINTGVYTNCKVGADVMLEPDEVCISDVLSVAGYETGYIGKWHLDLPELNVTDEPESGAQGWDAYTPPGPKRHGFQYWYSYGAWDDHFSPHYWHNSSEKIKVNQWSVEHETDRALEFIQNREQDRPFALFVSWNPPHSPFEQVPEKYRELYKKMDLPLRKNVHKSNYHVHTGEEVAGGLAELKENQLNYFAAITGIDDQFGRILQLLKEEELENETIVVLTSDHGEMMGSHGLMAKHVWYEESIGVPFAIRWPEVIPEAKSSLLLNTVDIMPTLLGLLNLHIPDSVEGTDLSQLIISRKSDGPTEAYLCAYPGRKEAIEEFQKAGLDNRAFGWRAIRTHDYTYVIHNGYAPGDQPVRHLYDLKKDPFQLQPEKINDPGSQPIASELDRKLRAWLKGVNDPFCLSTNVTINK
ncbi:sulfatase [Bacillus sp. FJAT-50079]|uniref:sulfatase family protein n=1 Tax=Bacillus sp. FJAT-50079 TaxID=2833577 RepID=UPI001BCA1A61|nr:sulfatase [Bacillus sp. FJAT-50079]MBS4206882.1 sulfatase [Bacillus sp. FJAT-50079]